MRAKGFTLVELLIVIIIIGILAGMLLLAVGKATDKAEATKIVNALRSYKSASLLYYSDRGAWPNTGTGWENSLDRYLDRSLDRASFITVEVIDWGNYAVIGLQGAIPSPLTTPSVQDKLRKQATASGLLTRSGGTYDAQVHPGEVFMHMR